MTTKFYFREDQATPVETPTRQAPPPQTNPALWPVRQIRHRVAWFPARHRLIGLVRALSESFVLPPAVIRKPSWRE